MSGPSIQKYGGRVPVHSPAPDHRLGDLRGFGIVIEFDDMDGARWLYEPQENTAARMVCEKATHTDLMLVEGL